MVEEIIDELMFRRKLERDRMLQMRLEMFKGLFEPRLQKHSHFFNAKQKPCMEKDIMLGLELSNPRVRDQNTFMNKCARAKRDEAGVILMDEQNDFLFADASRMEEIEELSANICLMARIQPADNTYDAGPSYDSAFISEVQSLSNIENEEQMYPTHTKIINSTIGDDQIDSDIIFDSPNRNVNSGSIEKDTHVPDLCNSEISLKVRDTEDTLDDASKSQQKVYEKINDPIAVKNKQNCWTIDYAQINALYKDFFPQKELSAEQKYFPSSFIPSDKNSNATPSIPASMPKRDNVKLEYQKLFNSIKKTRSQTQTEMDELIAYGSEKTYAYGAIRTENQNLLFTISELKTRLANAEKCKSVNTMFDKTNGSQPLLCVTPLNKQVIQKKTDVQKSKENHVVSKPATLQTSPAKQSGVNSNKTVIAPRMYKVVTTHESQTNEAKHY
ncbi:hypothetical protein Tco_0610393 [Tanacetum coccineum]